MTGPEVCQQLRALLPHRITPPPYRMGIKFKVAALTDTVNTVCPVGLGLVVEGRRRTSVFPSDVTSHKSVIFRLFSGNLAIIFNHAWVDYVLSELKEFFLAESYHDSPLPS